MGVISFEIVPRSEDALTEELSIVRSTFSRVSMINIPDLLSFEMRSWQAARLVQPHYRQVVPHLRAIDFDLEDQSSLQQVFTAGEFEAVLVITGDQPQDMSRRVYRNTAPDMIRALKQARPEMKVYAGIDPYRSGIKEELDYVERKLEAGADGFFTQPFFDLRFMDIYRDVLAGLDVYWGVTPVVSARSRDYWETRNNLVFPPDFETTLEWNRRFAQQALEYIERRGGNLYFMPIRVNLLEYLDGILT